MKHLISILTLAVGLVFLSGCSTTESRIAANPELFNSLTPDQQQMIRDGRVGIGFDQAMVLHGKIDFPVRNDTGLPGSRNP